MTPLRTLAALLLIAGLLLGSLAPEHVHAKQSVATFTLTDDGAPRPQPGPTPGGGGSGGGQSGGGASGQTGGSTGGGQSGSAGGQTGASGQTGDGSTDGGPPATGGETARAGNTNLPQTAAAARPAVTLGGLALLAAVAAIGMRRRAWRGPINRKTPKRRATR